MHKRRPRAPISGDRGGYRRDGPGVAVCQRRSTPPGPVVAGSCSGHGLGFFLFLEHEPDLVVVVDVDRHLAAADEAAEQQLVGERLADRVLDQARHRPRAHLRIEALLREELLQLRRERRLDLLLVQLGLELEQELVDDLQDDVVVELRERDRRVEAIAELRREQPLDLGHLVARLARVA